MNDTDIIEWASLLVDPKLSRQQIIQNLLDNCRGDGMTPTDKAVCVRALQLMKEGKLNDHAALSSIVPLYSGLLAPDEQDGDDEVELERVVD